MRSNTEWKEKEISVSRCDLVSPCQPSLANLKFNVRLSNQIALHLAQMPFYHGIISSYTNHVVKQDKVSMPLLTHAHTPPINGHKQANFIRRAIVCCPNIQLQYMNPIHIIIHLSSSPSSSLSAFQESPTDV